MPTLQGTDGDTTGALITTATTSTELTALVQPATHTDSGAMTAAEYDKLAAISLASINKVNELIDSVPDEAGLDGHIETAVIDLLATHANVPLVGTIAGRFFIVRSAIWVIESINGTITTGFTANCGNNVAKTNVVASAVNVSSTNLNLINTAGAPAPAPAQTLANANALLVTAATSFKVDVTIAAVVNSATAMTGKLVLDGYWIA